MKIKLNHIAFVCLFSICFEAYTTLKLTENKGQWNNNVLFKADLNSVKLFVSKGQLTYLFYSSKQVYEYQHQNVFKDQFDVHAVKINFLNANPLAEYLGQNPTNDYSNYYLGNQSNRWASGVKNYQKLYVKNIYNNIDFEFFEQYGNLKYNFIVHPGGNPQDIKMQYLGVDSLKILDEQVQFKTIFGTVNEMKPFVFEQTENKNREIKSSYQLYQNILSFNISGKRNTKNTLIIDPILVFSTYSGSRGDNFGYTATYDTLGNGYAGGTVFDFGFPTTTGAFQLSFNGGRDELRQIGYVARDCGITKYSKDGSTLLFSTYIGGSFSNEQPHSMVVNSKNQLLIMGSTKSTDFPLGTGNPYDNIQNGMSDIFVVKLSEDGRQLIEGTYIGGSNFDGLNGDRPSSTMTPLLYNYADDFRGEIILDENDDVYVASSTNSNDFPRKGANISSYGGKQDGCYFKLNSDLSDLIYSSFLGGSENDAAYGLDLSNLGYLYVTGGSNSQSLNYAAQGNSRTNFGGKADGFLVQISKDGGNILSNTFIGTSAYDQSYFVKTDRLGKPFVFGQTEGNMNASSGVYRNNNGKMFIKKYSVDLINIELETTFGALNKTLPDLSPTAFLIDECERIFVSGWGGFEISGYRGGGTNNMPISSDAFQKATDGHDFYLGVFSKNLSGLQYATYMGGRSSGNLDAHEHVDGGTSRFDKKGIVYHSVCAGCGGQSLFPTTPGVWSRTNNSDNCNNALFKFDFENLNRKPVIKDSIYEIYATDTLVFQVEASDLDLGDNLSIEFYGDPINNPNFPLPRPEVKATIKDPNLNKITKRLEFIASCRHIDLDTIYLKVKVYDQGCPTQDSNFATIKILVKDPPPSASPDVICMLTLSDRSVSINWNSFQKNKYFKHIILYRQNPDGRIIALDTIRNSNAGIYTDFLPSDPKTNNFVYYMVSFNICNNPFDAGYRVSSAKELNVAIDSTYMVYATVEDNKNIRINWLKSKENDFGMYEILRSETRLGKLSNFRKIAEINDIDDTTFLDTDVDVSQYTYCYKIIVNDKCGHYSKSSNQACNIVLSGETGRLLFNLDWTNYQDWFGKVRNYELLRQVDTGSMRFLTNTNLLRVYEDKDLDLWWGAYYYVVRAYEDTFNGSKFEATSLSNAIRLIQPPQVYVPNAFSPNGDLSNDVWGISHAFVKEYDLKVFNRWGEKVWQNDFKGNQWDGITRGKLAMNDVFIWIITYKRWDGKFYTQKGTVTVMP